MLAYVRLDGLPAEPARREAVFEQALRALGACSPTAEPDRAGEVWGAYVEMGRWGDSGRARRRDGGTAGRREGERGWPSSLALLLPVSPSRCPAVWPPIPDPRVGVGMNRLVARLAAWAAGPGEWLVVERDATRAFLEPLPVGLLPLCEESLERLELLGIRRVGQLLRLPRAALGGQVGPDALAVARALEVEGELLRAWRDEAWLVREVDLDGPLETRAQLAGALGPLAEALAATLRERGHGARTVRLRAAGSPQAGWRERQVHFAERSAEAARLLEAAERLAVELARADPPQADDGVEGRAPERLELGLGDLGPLGSRQPGLFEAQQRRLLAKPALAELRARFGERVRGPLSPGRGLG